VLEDHFRLEKLELEAEGFLRLEVISTDPAKYPISAFVLPQEYKYLVDSSRSYVISVQLKDGAFQYLFFLLLILQLFTVFFSENGYLGLQLTVKTCNASCRHTVMEGVVVPPVTK